MDPKLKAKWVKALRSGKYKQGNGHMRYIQGGGKASFCCLGVLRDITGADEAYWEAQKGTMPTADERHDWGLSSRDASKLASYNDGSIGTNDFNPNMRQLSFNQIASYIERRKTL